MQTGYRQPALRHTRIAQFTGNKNKSILNAKDIDELVHAINSLLNMQVKTGSNFQFLVGDYQCTLIIPPQSGGSGGNMNFRGEYDPTIVYAVGDVVVIRKGNSGGFPAGTFVCVKSAPGAAHPPTQPDTGNIYWISLFDASNLGQWT